MPPGNVTVNPGEAGTTSPADREALQQALEAFTEHDDLDIDAFSGAGTAIEDSCYVDTSGESLATLGEVTTPDPRDF